MPDSPKTVLCVVGTRPEVIKMAPVVRALRQAGIHAPVLATAQHRHLLDQMLEAFQLQADWDLDAMQADQTLGQLTGRLVPRLEALFQEVRPAAILAQGDTTTVFCAALAAFYAGIPFGHVEAGLRSGSLAAPFPEEGMRRLSAVVTRWHFAPTEGARAALLQEGQAPASIHVVGNTVIDALLEVAGRKDLPWPEGLPRFQQKERGILVTLHRRENFGAPLEQIFQVIRAFAQTHPTARFVYPVHPNPRVWGPAHALLGGLPNVHLLEPLDYPQLVAVLKASEWVLTDSGGLQEEAPALGRPVLVCRDVTERPEAVEAGGAKLVGTSALSLRVELDRLWIDSDHLAAMAQPRFPYGDGTSGKQIADILSTQLRQS